MTKMCLDFSSFCDSLLLRPESWFSADKLSKRSLESVLASHFRIQRNKQEIKEKISAFLSSSVCKLLQCRDTVHLWSGDILPGKYRALRAQTTTVWDQYSPAARTLFWVKYWDFDTPCFREPLSQGTKFFLFFTCCSSYTLLFGRYKHFIPSQHHISLKKDPNKTWWLTQHWKVNDTSQSTVPFLLRSQKTGICTNILDIVHIDLFRFCSGVGQIQSIIR